MGSIDEIVLIRKALEKLIDNPEDIPADAQNLIDELGNIKMSLKHLQKSKIGFTLNSIRKATSDEGIKKSAKSLIKKWQSLEESKPKDKDEKSTSKTSASEIPIDFEITAPLPTQNSKNQLIFPDHPEFKPNLTPKEVLQKGSFGGNYFRPIYSSVTKQKYGKEVWQELPKDWLEGLDIKNQVSSSFYDNSRNKYKVKCGASLEEWENSGWMDKQDPYGWFQWFCRFYQGRRTEDDERQIGRWARCAGETGRWKNNLISKIVKAGCAWDNYAVSPVVRQTLQHWAYQLNKEDFDKNSKKFKK
eukprot:TRINITY_DN29344_c0_g1_i1.p1 TRINITY_DN29344_c0_g1~~TRINITY_DN29344_c0_g1_i1.p1  ORF type:complete len:302 (+),score=90.68 TRINITY_DN29344_c0_g1_i1:38-943(+)